MLLPLKKGRLCFKGLRKEKENSFEITCWLHMDLCNEKEPWWWSWLHKTYQHLHNNTSIIPNPSIDCAAWHMISFSFCLPKTPRLSFFSEKKRNGAQLWKTYYLEGTTVCYLMVLDFVPTWEWLHRKNYSCHLFLYPNKIWKLNYNNIEDCTKNGRNLHLKIISSFPLLIWRNCLTFSIPLILCK